MPKAKSWADVTRDSEAMDEIRALLEIYLAPGSPVSELEALARIIGAVERHTGRELAQPAVIRLS
jgi:hypothetical protein